MIVQIMAVKVLFFGPAADAAGKSEIELDELADTDTLKQKLFGLFPGMQKLGFLVAVNKQLARGNTVLNDGDVVAVLPPYSGG